MVKALVQRGFTLIEAIVAIVITGILVGAVAVFISKPVEGYVDAVRRAELTDAADASLRRMGRDIRSAVPNSVRVAMNGGNSYLEYLPTSTGGRYRSSGSGDVLDFDTTGAESGFDVLGTASAAAAGDAVVVFNTGQCSNTTCTGVPVSFTPCAGANAYEGCNRRNVCSGGATLTFSQGACPAVGTNQLKFPFESPSKRFHIVPAAQQAVTYACENVGTNAANDGTGTLRRYWAYGIAAAQATPPGGSSALLANNVSACSIAYVQGDSLLSVTLSLTRSGETVSLYHEIHINNVP